MLEILIVILRAQANSRKPHKKDKNEFLNGKYSTKKYTWFSDLNIHMCVHRHAQAVVCRSCPDDPLDLLVKCTDVVQIGC